MENSLNKKRHRHGEKKDLEAQTNEDETNIIKSNDLYLIKTKSEEFFIKKHKNQPLNIEVKYTSKLLNSDNTLNQTTDFLSLIKRIQKEKNNEISINNSKFGFGNYTKFYFDNYLSPYKSKVIFQEEWIKDKVCLDIGSGDGSLLLIIALIYKPKSIEAIDIDPSMVKKAIEYLKFIKDRKENGVSDDIELVEEVIKRNNHISCSKTGRLDTNIRSNTSNNSSSNIVQDEDIETNQNPKSKSYSDKSLNNTKQNKDIEKIKLINTISNTKELSKEGHKESQHIKSILDKISAMPLSFLMKDNLLYNTHSKKSPKVSHINVDKLQSSISNNLPNLYNSNNNGSKTEVNFPDKNNPTITNIPYI